MTRPGARRAVGVIATVPPHADYVAEVAAHPLVEGLRLNTVMPIKGQPGDVLARLAGHGLPVWVDLKGRQLRVAEAAVPPYTAVRLSHRISVRTPTLALFDDGREAVRVLEVDGDRLILEDGPRRVVGPGEAVNIPDPTLVVEGTLTPGDRTWLAAGQELGLHDFMLSFCESPADLAEVRRLDPQARVLGKLESEAGLQALRRDPAALLAAGAGLVAARGDLYTELSQPHRILRAVREVVHADPSAVVASRLCDSLAWREEPAAADLSDVAWLLQVGYRRFLLGDQVCLRRDSLLAALNLIEAIAAEELGP